MTIIVSLTSLLVGAVLGVWFTEYIRRPNLAISGCTVSRGAGFSMWYLRVTNRPRLLGLSLGETRVAGRRLCRPLRIGVSVLTRPAVCTATVTSDDPSDTAKVVLSLAILGDGDPRFHHSVELAADQHMLVGVVAQVDADPRRFFVYRPRGSGDELPQAPKSEAAKFEGSKTFRVQVVPRHGGKKLDVRVRVHIGVDGVCRVDTGPSTYRTVLGPGGIPSGAASYDFPHVRPNRTS